MQTLSELLLGDIASREVLTVSADTPLAQVVQLFARHRVSAIVVAEGRQPVGIVTERDLLRLACVGYLEHKPVRSVMTAPLVTARQDMDFATAQNLLANRAVRHLVLVDEAGELRGVASETDFRRHIGHDLFAAIQNLGSVMEPSLELLDPNCTLAFALEAMASRRHDHVLIGLAGVAQGILTERDVPRLMAAHVDPERVLVSQVMSAPLRSIGVDTPVADAARIMDERQFRHLVVLAADGTLVGTLSQHRMLERLSTVLMEEGRAWLANQLEVVLATTGVGTWEFDHTRETLAHSPALSRLAGLEPGQLLGTLDDLLAQIDTEHQPRLEQAFRQQLASPSGAFCEDCQVRGAQGRERWLSLRGRVIERGPERQPLRSVGVAIDIDAQKAAEAHSSRSEARLLRLMEHVPLPLCQVNERLEVVYLNEHFERSFGYSQADIPNLDAWWLKAYPDASYRAWVLSNWQAAVEAAAQTGGVIRPDDYQVTCANGDVRVVEISGITLGAEFLATFIDVTQQRVQQQLLEFSNSILSQVSARAPQASVFEFICREIERRIGGLMCSVMLLDADGQHLRTAAAPSLPAAYSAALQNVPVGPMSGSCGSAAFREAPVLASDIATDPLWASFKHLAQPHGLAACWSSPIKAPEGQVLGTFALYWTQPVAHIPALVQQYVEAATALCAISIESERSQARLEHQLEELRRWQRVMLGREERVLELKMEVNALLARLGETPRYASVAPLGGTA